MNETLAEQFERVNHAIGGLVPNAIVEIEILPSAAMLDVHCNGRLFVLAYSPSMGFGVDEFEEEVIGLGSSYRYSFETIDAARDKLLELVRNATR